MAIDVGASAAVQRLSQRRHGRLGLRRPARSSTTVPIGTGVDGAGYDPATGDAFASNADGTLTVIHQDTPDTYHVVQTVQDDDGVAQHGARPDDARRAAGRCVIRGAGAKRALGAAAAPEDGSRLIRASRGRATLTTRAQGGESFHRGGVVVAGEWWSHASPRRRRRQRARPIARQRIA